MTAGVDEQSDGGELKRPAAPGVPVRILVDESDILDQIDHDDHEPSAVNGMGYDIRLGDDVYFIQRGHRRRLRTSANGEPEAILVYPGETIVVSTMEKLRLGKNVCATGSPRMGLLMKGLWAHGGKTDFGFKGDLLLGFHNHGNDKVCLHRGESIFHLTFWAVDQKDLDASTQAKGPSGRRPHVTMFTGDDPLTKTDFLTQTRRKAILRVDGMHPYRLMKQFSYGQRFMGWMLVLSLAIALLALVLSSIAVSGAQVLSWNSLGAQTRTVLIGVLSIGGVGAFVALVRRVFRFVRGEELEDNDWPDEDDCHS